MSLDLGFIGDIVGSVTDLLGGHNANQANIEQANANRWLAMNAHQVEVEDLYKAGLNPMLSYRGSGASQPSGQAHVENVAKDAGRKVSSAFTAAAERQAIAEGIKKTQEEAKLATNSAEKARQEGLLAEFLRTGKGPAEVDELGTRARGHEASASQALQEIEESKSRQQRMQSEMKEIASRIELQGMETALKKAQAEGAMVDTRLAQRTFYEVMEGIKNKSLITKYEAIEKELGAKAAQATWRVWLAEQGLTLTQIEKIMGALPNVALIYPLKTITNTTINPKK